MTYDNDYHQPFFKNQNKIRNKLTKETDTEKSLTRKAFTQQTNDTKERR